ncbi:MAG: hypothetical protein BZY87_02715 [SAR202 cluster bacterium Io17-Chloro-G6]|nr:MAG: hypothetical protein BZY87_02715 [SAR202 cluster bacterium Io17-Chloro-G6]
MALRTYAPAGKTPVNRHHLSRDHLSVISGITPTGKLYMMVEERPDKGPDDVNFLRHLLRHIPGKLLVLWDGAFPSRDAVCGAAECDFLAGLGNWQRARPYPAVRRP